MFRARRVPERVAASNAQALSQRDGGDGKMLESTKLQDHYLVARKRLQ
jgi:hypothetical protein